VAAQLAPAQACPRPTTATFNLPAKGCGSGCLNGDKLYASFSSAWNACPLVPGCAFILNWYVDGLFYLRRSSDPDRDQHQNMGMNYACEAQEGPAYSLQAEDTYCGNPWRYGLGTFNGLDACAEHVEQDNRCGVWFYFSEKYCVCVSKSQGNCDFKAFNGVSVYKFEACDESDETCYSRSSRFISLSPNYFL